MDLNLLATFHRVAEHGGLGRAARALGRSKATLSRHVAELEKELRLRLFERSGAALRLTEEGRALLASTKGPLDELHATEDSLHGRGVELQGRLRVSVPLMLGSHAMGAIAARFATANPKVRLEVIAQDRYVDLIQEGFDVAIRFNPRPEDDLVGRCFMRDKILIIAAPTLDRPITDASTGMAAVPAVVRAIGDDAGPWNVDDGGKRFTLMPDPILRVSTLAICDAVLSGVGVGRLPSLFVRDHIASGRLVSWGAMADRPLEMWVLHASARLASKKVRAFTQFVTQSFAGELDTPLPEPALALPPYQSLSQLD